MRQLPQFALSRLLPGGKPPYWHKYRTSFIILPIVSAGRVDMAAERMICDVPATGRVEVRLRPLAINILVGHETPSYSFDLAGRLIGAFVGGANYRRGLDNRVLRKWRGPDGARERRWLGEAEAAVFLADTYGLADRVAVTIGDDRLAVLRGWDTARLQADAARFAEVYRPVSILPPDQYLALVIQATEGCSYNRCTFCDFYRGRPFRVKGPDELRAHLAAVQAFFGPAIGLRKTLFLADANALVAPMPRLRTWLDVITETPGLPDGGIYSFMDAFDVHHKAAAGWAELASRGLRRVYIGMESGDDELLRFLRKPGAAADVVEAVTTLKMAGVAVSVIVMLGVGGERFAAGHTAHTVAALNAMPLGAGDIVYFSPFVDHAGLEYSQLAASTGLRPLAAHQIIAQEGLIRAGLRLHDPAHPPQISRYDIREFIY